MTIMEVLVAGIILSMVGASLYLFVWQAFKDWNRIRRELSLFQNVSRALETITTDLRRVPAPFFPTTPAGGTGDPIEINASSPPIRPLNYAFKGGSMLDPNAPNDPTKVVGSALLFRVNYLDQKKSPPEFKKVLVRYFGVFPKVADPNDVDYNPLDPAVLFKNQHPEMYQKLIRVVCEQNPALLATPSLRKKYLLGYQWVGEDLESNPEIGPQPVQRYQWKEGQVILDALKEFSIEFVPGTVQGDPRWGIVSSTSAPAVAAEQLNVSRSWDFFSRIGLETSGGLPAAVRIVLTAWSEGHTDEDFGQAAHQTHRQVTMRTAVMIPVWRYE